MYTARAPTVQRVLRNYRFEFFALERYLYYFVKYHLNSPLRRSTMHNTLNYTRVGWSVLLAP